MLVWNGSVWRFCESEPFLKYLASNFGTFLIDSFPIQNRSRGDLRIRSCRVGKENQNQCLIWSKLL